MHSTASENVVPASNRRRRVAVVLTTGLTELGLIIVPIEQDRDKRKLPRPTCGTTKTVLRAAYIQWARAILCSSKFTAFGLVDL